MDFQSFRNSFCPILTAGIGELTPCQSNCEWRNPATGVCDMCTLSEAVIASRQKKQNQQRGNDQQA